MVGNSGKVHFIVELQQITRNLWLGFHNKKLRSLVCSKPELKIETQKQSPNMTEQENVFNGFVNVAPPKVTQFMILFSIWVGVGGWMATFDNGTAVSY